MPDEVKEYRFDLRLTDRQKRKLARLAAYSHCFRADVVRRMIDEAEEPEKESERESEDDQRSV